jgi:hypothetical protein
MKVARGLDTFVGALLVVTLISLSVLSLLAVYLELVA